MEKYIVKPEDLKEKIKDFPLEVVQRMVDYQREQGNKANVLMFQECSIEDKDGGGFEWTETNEGWNFWNDIICNKKFNLFFKKYPKNGRSDNQIETIEIDGKKYNKKEVLEKINKLKEIK